MARSRGFAGGGSGGRKMCSLAGHGASRAKHKTKTVAVSGRETHYHLINGTGTWDRAQEERAKRKCGWLCGGAKSTSFAVIYLCTQKKALVQYYFIVCK